MSDTHPLRTKERYVPSKLADFLATGRVCLGPVCLESNPGKGCTRTKESFDFGAPYCQICMLEVSRESVRRIAQGLVLIPDAPKPAKKERHRGKALGPRIKQPEDPTIRICTKCKIPRPVKTYWTESTLRRYMPCKACRNVKEPIL